MLVVAATLVVFPAPASAGSAWRATTLPTLGQNPSVGQQSLSCPASGTCVAVGRYADLSQDDQHALIETESGGNWSAGDLPLDGLNPPVTTSPGADSTVSILFRVVCPVSGWCAATGEYQTASGGLAGIIAILDNGTWTATTVPSDGLNPATLSPPILTSTISCPAAGWCVAVGSYGTGSVGAVVHLPLAVIIANGTVTAHTLPTADLNPASSGGAAQLIDVSCAAAGSCVGVGTYDDPNGVGRGLIETLNNGAWTDTTAPTGALNPPTARGIDGLSNVSCSSSGDCITLGTYNAGQEVLSEAGTVSTGTWSDSTLSLAGLNPAPAASTAFMTFAGVGCVSGTSFCAAGTYTDASGGAQALVATNGVLSTASLAGLSPASSSPPHVQLDSELACPTNSYCVAGGNYYDGSAEQGLIATFSGGTWSLSTFPTSGLSPSLSFGPPQVPGVSCDAPADCVMVGFYNDTVGHGDLLAVQTVDTTSTTVSCTPGSVSLLQSTTCTATIADTDTGTTSAPTGTVTFSASSSGGTFSPSSTAQGTCTLTAISATQSSCQVTYTPGYQEAAGPNTMTASYAGDPSHVSGSGTVVLTIGVPHATVSPTSLSFGRVHTGKTSEQSVTVTNPTTATGALNITGANNTGAAEFTIDWPNSTCRRSGISLASGQSCTIAELFSPTKSTNTKTGVTGTLTIVDNDPTAAQTVNMTGR